ncbi:hypothetical protein IGI04_018225 [Brassica rapa subsp. trilocularis]|uniref:Reverse transcriptase zinc-binding domain-containing protein n=1 Tax=Brassica rapa subsp. trilocularis TaxID=1813537 RepID=A0ABQ7MFW7_BRACM|nr:hypothetical protein IGI04_018225 [Brassica rapa subsp. trilocularis]
MSTHISEVRYLWDPAALFLCLASNTEPLPHKGPDLSAGAFKYSLYATYSLKRVTTSSMSAPIQRLYGKAKTLLTWLAWKATLYWLWNERNSRLHNNTFRSVDSLSGV